MGSSATTCTNAGLLPTTSLGMHFIEIYINTLRPRQNGCHFVDMFKCIFLNENVWIPIKISLKFVPKGSINNNPALFQIMAWRRPSNKPLSEPMMVSSLMHICVTRPQWVNMQHFLMMTSSNGNIFHVTVLKWGESTGDRWIPLTKASDAELWCFLWSAPEQMVE